MTYFTLHYITLHYFYPVWNDLNDARNSSPIFSQSTLSHLVANHWPILIIHSWFIWNDAWNTSPIQNFSTDKFSEKWMKSPRSLRPLWPSSLRPLWPSTSSFTFGFLHHVFIPINPLTRPPKQYYCKQKQVGVWSSSGYLLLVLLLDFWIRYWYSSAAMI